MSRRPVIAGNWKMYKLIAESVATALELKPLVANANHCEAGVAPVLPALKTVAGRLSRAEPRPPHGRGRRRHAEGRGRVARHRRPFGATALELKPLVANAN